MESKICKITKICLDQIFNKGNLNKAVLASLRNSSSINDHNMTIVWPIIFRAVNKVCKDQDSDKNTILSDSGKPTEEEKAIYTALRCYAMFQQGTEEQVYSNNAKNDQDEKKLQLFTALKMINDQTSKADDKSRSSLDKRVNSVLAMTNCSSIINSIYHLIGILKSKTLPKDTRIDFSQLAQDIYSIQFNRKNMRRIALKWGQQYYYWSPKEEKEDK